MFRKLFQYSVLNLRWNCFCRQFSSIPVNPEKSKFVLHRFVGRPELCSRRSTHSNKDKLTVDERQQQAKMLVRMLAVKNSSDVVTFLMLAFAAIYYFYNRKNKIPPKIIEVEWVKIPKFTAKFFKYNGYTLPFFVKDALERIDLFKVRNDDVWVCSYPKSGTTWVQEIVYLIQTGCNFEKAKASKIDDRIPYFELAFPSQKTIDQIESPRILKSHLPYDFLPDEMKKQKCKIIYIMRNPKDVIISLHFFQKLVIDSGFKGVIPDTFNLFMDGLSSYGPWTSHVKSYWALRNDENALVLQYEDLHKDLREAIRKIARFLGKDVTAEQVEKIAEWCSFANMKENPSTNYSWFKIYGFFRKEGHFMRRGQIGDWLKFFSVPMSKKVDDMVQKDIQPLGIEFDFGISSEDLQKLYQSPGATEDSDIKDTV